MALLKTDEALKRAAPKIFYGWIIVGVAWLINLASNSYFNPVLGVFVKPLADEFQWSRTSIAGAVTAGTVLGAIVSPLIGPILDRRGTKLVVVVGFSVITLCLFSLAGISSLWHFYLAYGLGRAVATGVTSLSSTVAVSNWFIKYRARAMGISITGIRAGAALMPLMVQLVILGTGSWRISWLFLAFLVAATTVIPSLLFLRRRPEDFGLLPDGVASTPMTEGTASATSDAQAKEVSWTLKEAMRTTSLWLLILATSQFFFVSGAVNLHLLPYLTDQGISPAMAVLSVTVLALAGAFGSVLWGLLAERLSVRWTFALGLLSSGLVVFFLLLVQSFPMAMIFAVAYGFTYGGLVGLAPVVFADYFGRASLGTIRGFATPFQLATNSTGFLFAAAVYDINKSYAVAFVVLGVAYLTAGVWTLLARPPVKSGASMGGAGSRSALG